MNSDLLPCGIHLSLGLSQTLPSLTLSLVAPNLEGTNSDIIHEENSEGPRTWMGKYNIMFTEFKIYSFIHT